MNVSGVISFQMNESLFRYSESLEDIESLERPPSDTRYDLAVLNKGVFVEEGQ